MIRKYMYVGQMLNQNGRWISARFELLFFSCQVALRT